MHNPAHPSKLKTCFTCASKLPAFGRQAIPTGQFVKLGRVGGDAITAPFYRVNEICDAERLFDEVAQALKVTKAVFEKRIATLFGSSDNLDQSEDSKKHVTAQKL